MTPRVDVLVVGAGLGGIAAALSAAETGAKVMLTEQWPSIGGQLTTQLVPCPDEHPLIESVGRTRRYAQLRDAIRAHYGGASNPGNGWVSRLCHEPRVAEHALLGMLRSHLDAGRIELHTGWEPAAATTVDGVIDSVTLVHARGSQHRVQARVVVDATETGDLLALAGVPWVVGSEGFDAHHEPGAVPGGPDPLAEQACTWVVALEWGEEFLAVERPPPGYAGWRDRQPFTLSLTGHDGVDQPYRMFDRGPAGAKPFWTYRRIRDASRGRGPDVVTINWASNDYAEAGLIAAPRRAHRQARQLTAAFVHWLRTEVPRQDGGRGYPNLRPATQVTGTADGMALAPYVRESRRVLTDEPMTVHDLLAADGSARARLWPDSVALGWYWADVHRRVGRCAGGHPDGAFIETAPFQIPARALVAGPNLLAGAKNIAVTQMAASATRVHPAEWAIGEAAGTIAALAATRRRTVASLLDDEVALARVQWILARSGAPVFWATDLDDGCDVAAAAQVLAIRAELVGQRRLSLELDIEKPCDATQRHTLAAALRSCGVPC
ncbi:MAG: FAD-dependent oxidoreductase, partial [Ornithinimicrobium sp.]